MDLKIVPVPSLHVADYVVIAMFLSVCMAIGVYYGYQTNKIPTMESYFLGNRRLLLLPVALSLYVTYASAISLMGTPAEIYVYGIRGAYAAIPYYLSLIIANSTTVPLLFPLRLTSAYEYLQLRFHSNGVRTLGTILGMLGTVGYMGIALYVPALAFQVVAGISIVVIGLVGTIYTAILLPYFVLDVMRSLPGVSGIFISCLFSGTLSVTALMFNMWMAVGSQMYGVKTITLTQNPTSGCYPYNFTITMNESAPLMYNYNTTLYTTPYDVTTGHSSISRNSTVITDEGFFLYNISYVWYGFTGFFLTLIIGIVVSLFTGGDRGQPVEARLIFPICRKLCCVKTETKYDVNDTEDQEVHTARSMPAVCLQTKDNGDISQL